jgi:HPt (histidine-containing phosphotransfer) domain-containing protein
LSDINWQSAPVGKTLDSRDPASRPDAAAALAVDAEVISQLRMLQQPGAPDMLRQLAQLFVTQVSTSVNVLRGAISRADTKLLYETAHTLKSSSSSLGAKKLAALFEQLERMGRSNTPAGAAEILDAAMLEFDAVCTALEIETGISATGHRTPARRN